LFENTSRSVTPASSSAWINWSGIPHRPKPPTASVAPLVMSATALAADSYTFDVIAPSQDQRTSTL
jgi:hypothetical protein